MPKTDLAKSLKPKDINTNNKSSVSSSYRNPTDEEFWSAIRKVVVTYEEPSHKWSQLGRMARKHVDKKNFERLPFEEQNKIFSQIYGNENPLNSAVDKNIKLFNAKVSALIAFESLKRFERLAFDMWHQNKEIKDAKICNQEFLQEIFGETFAQFQKSEIAWLDFWVNNSFAWHKILDPDFSQRDPLYGAPLSRFLGAFRDRLHSDPETQPIPIRDIWHSSLKTLKPLLSGGFLCEKILLVEGQTELILLPAFAKLLHIDLNKISVHMDASGGAQQMVKQYLNLRDIVSIPIMCLLDSDAKEQTELISDSLRDSDRLLIIEKGEIEDIFLDETIFRSMQTYMSEMGFLDTIQFEDLLMPSELSSENEEQTRVAKLDRLCRSRGLGAFDKVSFAKVLANKLEVMEIPAEAREILHQLKNLDPEKKGLRFNG